jgi:toxin ParE1/3/4
VILEWLPAAIEDRKNAFSFIELDSPRAAAENDTKLVEAVLRLVDFPHSGRPGRVAETRELVITGTSYLAVYRIVDERVVIIRLFHTAQDWPDEVG